MLRDESHGSTLKTPQAFYFSRGESCVIYGVKEWQIYDSLNYSSTITSSLTDLIKSKETTRFPPSSK